MKKNTIIVIVIVVILLILAIWFLMRGKNSGGQPANVPATGNSQNQANPTTNSQTAQNGANNFAGSLSDLMAKKTPQNCQVSYNTNGTAQTQSLYFDGTNLRTDIAMNVGGQQTTMHALIKDGWEYVWNDTAVGGMAANMGIKMNFAQVQEQQQAQTSPGGARNNGLDTQKTMNFSCTPWIADASKFDLPSNIQFQDLTSLAQPAGGTPGTATSACDMCKIIPAGDARTKCEASCNAAPAK